MSVVALETGQSDAEKAQDYRARIRAALDPVVAILNEARRDGLVVGFNIGLNQFGLSVLNQVDISKPL
jgi:hypothetical protein